MKSALFIIGACANATLGAFQVLELDGVFSRRWKKSLENAKKSRCYDMDTLYRALPLLRYHF